MDPIFILLRSNLTRSDALSLPTGRASVGAIWICQLVFRGVADIEQEPMPVPVGIWRITQALMHSIVRAIESATREGEGRRLLRMDLYDESGQVPFPSEFYYQAITDGQHFNTGRQHLESALAMTADRLYQASVVRIY